MLKSVPSVVAHGRLGSGAVGVRQQVAGRACASSMHLYTFYCVVDRRFPRGTELSDRYHGRQLRVERCVGPRVDDDHRRADWHRSGWSAIAGAESE